MTWRLGVDALNLVNDQRGMGRVVRAVLEVARRRPGVDLTLLGFDRVGLGRHGFPVERPGSADVRGRFDAVWFPWNGVRFPSRAPALVTMHDTFAFDDPAGNVIARRREQQPIRRAARDAKRIVTDSAYSRERIVSVLRVDPRRIAVAPPGPSLAFIPRERPAPVGDPFVLFVTGPERRKNAPFLIDAFAHAFPNRDVALTIVGRLEPAAEKMVSDGRVNVVRARPDDDELAALYRGALAVAVPSLGEGFGLVAAEAQACGGAVIAADAGALPEVTGDAALLLDPSDRAAWVAALRALRADEALAERLRRAGVARWPIDTRERGAEATIDLLAGLVG